MIAQLVTASLAAYAFAVREFRGRTLLFLLFLSTLMIPLEVTLIPNYQTIVAVAAGRIRYIGLIAPFVATGFGTFLLRQFFLTIPKELHDAATLDGCGSLRFLLTIVIPLSRPALGTLAVYSFLQTWNQYLWPLLVTNSRTMRTIADRHQLPRATRSRSPTTLIMAGRDARSSCRRSRCSSSGSAN